MALKSISVKRNRKFYSPLRYPGGKAILSDFFFELIGVNDLVNCTYVEPYAGGAGAALSLLMLEKVNNIIINDLDVAIYSFWESVLRDSERFTQKINSVSVTIDEWHKQKQIYQDLNSSRFDRGFATFFLNRTNHSGVIEGRPIGGLDQSGPWKIDARFNKVNLIARVEKIARYKDRITVSNMDGIELMKQVVNLSKVLIYIDPPYYVKGSFLYLNHYERSNHKALATFLNEHPTLNWLLTYDNVRQIRSLYPERSKYRFDLFYHTQLPKRGSEILIKSDSLAIPQ